MTVTAPLSTEPEDASEADTGFEAVLTPPEPLVPPRMRALGDPVVPFLVLGSISFVSILVFAYLLATAATP